MKPKILINSAIWSYLSICSLHASAIFFSGDLRTDASVLACGSGCTLGPADPDSAYAQFAAVVTPFTVPVAGPVEAITYSYGGGVSLTGAVLAGGGLEPYLSLFDASGDFIASTFAGITCPPGAQTVGGNCFDVMLDAGVLAPGTYEVALTAFENMSLAENAGGGLTLADGFTGLGNLAPGENLNYAFDIVLPDGAVPEPGTWIVVAAFVGLLNQWRRRRSEDLKQ